MQSSPHERLNSVSASVAFDSEILSALVGKVVHGRKALLFFASLTFIGWYTCPGSAQAQIWVRVINYKCCFTSFVSKPFVRFVEAVFNLVLKKLKKESSQPERALLKLNIRLWHLHLDPQFKDDFVALKSLGWMRKKAFEKRRLSYHMMQVKVLRTGRCFWWFFFFSFSLTHERFWFNFSSKQNISHVMSLWILFRFFLLLTIKSIIQFMWNPWLFTFIQYKWKIPSFLSWMLMWVTLVERKKTLK